MHGAGKTTTAALASLGLALVVGADPALGRDGAVSGPAAAIAKARAAADRAEDRAAEHDAEAATALAPDTQPARPSTTGSERAAETAQDPAPEVDAVDTPQRTYDVASHRDPFEPPRLKGTQAARTPLETYQLGQLKLVGVVAQLPEGYRAMVEDSAGLGYIITTGTPIGSSGGVVRSIEPRRVVIEESTRDFYGDVKPKEVVMELPQEDRSP